MALGELAARWSEIVGDRLARECAPAGLEGRLLIVRASSRGWAAQIGFLSEEIRRRAEAVTASGDIAGIRVVVGPMKGRTRPD
jgi:hypothetical protein